MSNRKPRKRYDPQAAFERNERKRKREEKRKNELKRFMLSQPSPHLAAFSREVRRNAARLLKYIMSGWCKLSLESKVELLREFLPSDAPFLALNNPEARIRFYRIWSHHIRAWNRDKKRVHHVTITPRQFVVPMYSACEFNLFRLQQWVRHQLSGFNAIGIVEGGFFSNGSDAGGPAMSWHVHIVVFDADLIALAKVKKRLNAQFAPLTLGRKTMDTAVIGDNDHDLMRVASYMAKEESLQEYRKYTSEPPKTELDELEGSASARAPQESQKDRRATPKTQLAIRAITKGKHFDNMIFAVGDCAPLLEIIRRDLLADLPWSKRARRESQFRGCFEGRPRLRDSESAWVRLADGYQVAEYDDLLEKAARYGEPGSPEFEAEEKRLADSAKELD